MLGFKGQGALEYLLLIGGAIIVAVIVIGVLSGQASDISSNQTNPNAGKCAALPDNTRCTSCAWADFDNDGDLDCTWDNATGCVPDPTVDTLCQT